MTKSIVILRIANLSRGRRVPQATKLGIDRAKKRGNRSRLPLFFCSRTPLELVAPGDAEIQPVAAFACARSHDSEARWATRGEHVQVRTRLVHSRPQVRSVIP